ncbi:hypothetical protein [Clostridium sp. ZS1]|uniref:hypothetical protein n=1 Tax=Clostridium sp. ZS1 TaxID=2949989 RepID=UPI001DE52FBC|nr:hypothetical protein [Clostridium sp. ZS1]MBN1067587.1 hypothetical protein [Clostridium botulinum]
MNLNQIINDETALVVINKSVNNNSTINAIRQFTLNAWKMNREKASSLKYVIGIRYGIGISCYEIDRMSIRGDGRVIFSPKNDLSSIVKDADFKQMGIRKGHGAFQYLKKIEALVSDTKGNSDLKNKNNESSKDKINL